MLHNNSDFNIRPINSKKNTKSRKMKKDPQGCLFFDVKWIPIQVI